MDAVRNWSVRPVELLHFLTSTNKKPTYVSSNFLRRPDGEVRALLHGSGVLWVHAILIHTGDGVSIAIQGEKSHTCNPWRAPPYFGRGRRICIYIHTFRTVRFF